VALFVAAVEVVREPIITVVVLCALSITLGVRAVCLLRKWRPAQRIIAPHWNVWLALSSAGILAIVLFAAMLMTWPKLRATYTPDGFARAPEIAAQRGWYPTETDPAGRRYVWTQERATLVFNFLVRAPVTMTFEVRSAAVAGGPDAPVRVIVNGKEVGELRPDPRNPDFQPLSLRFTPFDWGGRQTEVKLLTTSFKPRSDNRTLGTMIKSVSVDKTEAWSPVQRRIWLLWALPAVAALALALLWIARWRCSAWAGYGAVAAWTVGAACTAFLTFALLQIGPIQGDASFIWVAVCIYIGAYFSSMALALPFGRPDAPSLARRAWIGLVRCIPALVESGVRRGRPAPSPASSGANRRMHLMRDLMLVFAIALGARVIWAVVVPPWQAPDEPDHYIYISHIVEQKEIPHPPFVKAPEYPPEWEVSAGQTFFGQLSTVVNGGVGIIPFVPIVYDYRTAQTYETSVEARRSAAGARATPYPPLYYLFEAAPYWLFRDAPILSRLFAVRCGSAVLGALSCVFGYLMGYEIRRQRRWGWAVGLCMALMPMYAFITATVNNDAGADLGATIIIWLTVRMYRQHDASRPLALALGIASGLALATKPSIIAIVAVAGLVVVANALSTLRRSWRSVKVAFMTLGAYTAGMIATYGPWALFRVHYYGDVGRSGTGATAAVRYSLISYLGIKRSQGGIYFDWLLLKSFWGDFGWLDAPMPERIFTPIGVLYMVGALGLLVQLVLQPQRRRALSLLLGMLAAQAIFLFIGVDYQTLLKTGALVGLQGRYFFPILAPLLFLLLSGWDHLCREHPLALRFAPVFMLWLYLVGLATVLARYYGVVIG